MKMRPVIQFRFRDEEQWEKCKAEAERAGLSLNEYICRRLEGPKLDISRRKA